MWCENEWKMAATIVHTNKCLKVDKAIFSVIQLTVLLLQALHIVSDLEQPYQIILDQDVIRAIRINADFAEGIFKWHDITISMQEH